LCGGLVTRLKGGKKKKNKSKRKKTNRRSREILYLV